ncbi:MAG: hypothetical protein ABSC23_05585 [Bryobacteraceae bacterium]|jgi:hypothetical protein
MPRWIAIRASAAVAIAGSAACLLLAGWMAGRLLLAPPSDTVIFAPSVLKVAGVSAALVLAGISVWGIYSGIGILRRRGWARISLMIFAGLLSLSGGGGALALLFAPFPGGAGADQRLADSIRGSFLAVYVAMTLVGAFWLALFSRPPAKRYFAEGGAVAGAARPLGIRSIAWCLLASAASTALAAVLRVPVAFFGLVVTGWMAAAAYTVFTAVQIYLGAGLLQLDERARIWSMAYFCFAGAEGLAAAFMPGQGDALGKMLGNWLQVEPPTLPIGWFIGIASVVCAAVPVWFLARGRAVFRVKPSD